MYLLQKPTGIFYFRRVLPLHIAEKFGLPREIRFSLKTRDAMRAHTTSRRYASKIDELIAAVSMPKPFFDVNHLTVSFSDTNRIENAKFDPGDIARMDEILANIDAHNKTHPGPAPMTAKEAWAREAEIQAQKKPREIVSHTFAAVCDEFIASRRVSKKWTEKSEQELVAIFETWGELLSPNWDVSAMFSLDIETARNDLMRLPPRRKIVPRWRGKAIHEILREIDASILEKIETLSETTVNKHIDRLSELFEFALRRGYVTVNPVHGLRIARTVTEKAHNAITDQEVRSLFALAHFSAEKWEKPHRYWLPILGAYTGARINELAQIRVADIQKNEGVWGFFVRGRTKNKSAERFIPFHCVVLNCGLLNYVEYVKAQGYDRLFPELTEGRDGFGQGPSKWYCDRFLHQTGLKRDGLVFHSFRHAVAGKLVNEVNKNEAAFSPTEFLKIKAALGHKSDDITLYYGEFSPETIHQVINLLDYGATPPRFSRALLQKRR